MFSVLCPTLRALLAMLAPLVAPLLAPRVAPPMAAPRQMGLTVVGRGLGPKLVWLPLLLVLILLRLFR